jgi:hypothetical protein
LSEPPRKRPDGPGGKMNVETIVENREENLEEHPEP